MTDAFGSQAQKICLYSGVFALVGFLIGGVAIGHFVPPFIHPDDGAREVASKYAEHADRTKLGAMITMISLSCLAPWGMAVAVQIRAREGARPVLAYLQVASATISTTIVVFMPMFWALAAFRAGDIDPETTRAFSDTGFFLIVWPYFPFSIWVASFGLAVLLDKSEKALYPRWLGYFGFWNALVYVPAGVMSFFKDGPFAWNGLFALYLPLAMFFAWMVMVTYYSFQNLRDQ